MKNKFTYIFVRREIYSAQILPFSDSAAESSSTVWMFEIRGIAFLWHMVRCIMAVLFMVGGKDCDGGSKPIVLIYSRQIYLTIFSLE